VRLEHRNYGGFKVPSLRDALRHYSELNEERLHSDGERLLLQLRLGAAETEDLLAFLGSLNEADPPRRRRGLGPGACAVARCIIGMGVHQGRCAPSIAVLAFAGWHRLRRRPRAIRRCLRRRSGPQTTDSRIQGFIHV